MKRAREENHKSKGSLRYLKDVEGVSIIKRSIYWMKDLFIKYHSFIVFEFTELVEEPHPTLSPGSVIPCDFSCLG